MILPAISITLSSYIHTHTIHTYTPQPTTHKCLQLCFPLPLSRMDYLLDMDVEMELLSAIAFVDDVLTQQEQLTEHIDDTTTILDSLPSNNKEAAISTTDTANRSTEVAVSPNEASRIHLLSLLELRLPPLRFVAVTPNTSLCFTIQFSVLSGTNK